MTRRLFLVLAAFCLGAAGCGDEASTPTSPSTPAAAVYAVTKLFTGTLGPHGSAFYSFTVPQDSGVSITLASVAPTSGRGATGDAIGLGLGVPRGTGCSVAAPIVATADLAAQIKEWRHQGVQCVAVFDPGTLPGEIAFAVRIVYYQ